MFAEFPLAITALAAALNGAILYNFTLTIALYRRMNRVSHGDDDNHALAKRRRGHANAAENIPITLIMLGFVEGLGSPMWTIWLVAGALTVGRTLHAYAFGNPNRPQFFRLIGITLTLLSQFTAIVTILLMLFL